MGLELELSELGPEADCDREPSQDVARCAPARALARDVRIRIPGPPPSDDPPSNEPLLLDALADDISETDDSPVSVFSPTVFASAHALSMVYCTNTTLPFVCF